MKLYDSRIGFLFCAILTVCTARIIYRKVSNFTWVRKHKIFCLYPYNTGICRKVNTVRPLKSSVLTNFIAQKTYSAVMWTCIIRCRTILSCICRHDSGTKERLRSIIKVLLCSAGIIIRVCERLIENWKYFRISRLIEGAQQAIEVHPTTEGVAKLQNLIDARRSINVLEFGYFHKKLANKLSKLYENISL